jgi:hypothetical protein
LPAEGHVAIFVTTVLLPWFRWVAGRDFGLRDKFEVRTLKHPIDKHWPAEVRFSVTSIVGVLE